MLRRFSLCSAFCFAGTVFNQARLLHPLRRRNISFLFPFFLFFSFFFFFSLILPLISFFFFFLSFFFLFFLILLPFSLFSFLFSFPPIRSVAIARGSSVSVHLFLFSSFFLFLSVSPHIFSFFSRLSFFLSFSDPSSSTLCEAHGHTTSQRRAFLESYSTMRFQWGEALLSFTNGDRL